MAYIMYKGRGKRHLKLMLRRSRTHLASNSLHQLARGMEHTNGVGETSVGRAREYELREAKLPDPPQPLE